jgi:hypothetical protein
MTAPDDRVATSLSGWRQAELNATAAPWEVHRSSTIGIRLASDEEDWPLAEGFRRGGDAEFAAVARTAFPRLLAAIEAVLKLHYRKQMPFCETCGTRERWPCPTYRAISAALLGDEAANPPAPAGAAGEDGEHDR